MTADANPYLPNPDAALETSAELTGAGKRLAAAVDSAIARIEAIESSNPWGNDEPGQAFQRSLGDTGDIKAAMRSVGEGVAGFGAIATGGVERIVEIDKRHAGDLGDIRL